MENVKFITKKIDELLPASYNPRKDLRENDIEYQQLKKSIETFGYVENVIFNKRTNQLVGGHQRIKVLKDLGYKEILVAVVNLPLEKEKALNIGLNKIGGDWDYPLLRSLLEELENSDIDMLLTGFSTEEIDALLDNYLENEEQGEGEESEEDKYTTKIDIPHYEITGEKPDIKELVDTSKSIELTNAIEKADISEEEKDFLRKATTRHIQFNYKNIAEFYAHASKEVQELMEQSALVIIDFDKAIANGYAKLANKLDELRIDEFGEE